MSIKTIAGIAFVFAALANAPASAQSASGLVSSGGRVVAMAVAPDGQIALTIQANNAAYVCLMQKPSGMSINTKECYKAQ